MLGDKRKKLFNSVELLRKYGSDAAYTEYDYQITKAKRAAIMAAEGTSATLMNQILKGQEDVALAALKRDLAKSVHMSQLEFINALKIDLRYEMLQYEKEWSNEE